MKLTRLGIDRLPGIDRPFDVRFGGAGVSVVFGPNGIGKSSLCRAVEALWWSERGPEHGVAVSAEFDADGRVLRAERDGRRLRWWRDGEAAGPPELPAAHHDRSFFLRLRDLIDDSPDGTREIAAEIRRQMSGGVDLDSIRQDLFSGVGPRHGRRERDDFNKSQREVQEAEGQQAQLQGRADQLAALRAELEAHDAGIRRRAAVERAIGLAGRLQKFAQIHESLTAMPGALATLTGGEAASVGKLGEQIDGLDARTRGAESQRSEAEERASTSGLADPVEEVDLAACRERVAELGRVEPALQAARVDQRAERSGLEAALAALGGGPVDEVALGVAEAGQLFEFLRAAADHRSRTDAAEDRLRLLAVVDQPESEGASHEDLQQAIGHLRSWLRTPGARSFAERFRDRRLWLLAALVLLAVGAVLGLLVEPMLWLLAAAGAGFAVPVLVLNDTAGDPGARERDQAAFGALGMAPPDAWAVTPVGQRLRGLESELAAVEAKIQRARDREIERKRVETDLERLASEATGLDDRRGALQERLKLETIRPDAELVDWARALDQFRAARIRDEAAQGKVRELEVRHAGLLAEVSAFLARHGQAEPTDAAAATANLDRLTARDRQLQDARASAERAERQLQEIAVDRARHVAGISEIYRAAGLEDGDLPGLTSLMAALPEYRELASTATRLESQIDLDRGELDKAGEAGLAELDTPELEAMRDGLDRAGEMAQSLRSEIAGIEAGVRDARRGHTMQDLIARREDARARLHDRRDEALFARAGRFLVDSVEAEYEQAQMPRVLERARDHFSGFTHHKYELRLSRDAAAPRLFALDALSGEGRTLEELSDGTRAQLLLAARIAFAEEVERGTRLPLFLDEALDQSDPERFDAIVRGLGRLAVDQGRQIVYLTSDPLDVERIRRALAAENEDIAAAIDLGLIRTEAVSVKGPEDLEIVPRPEVPAPGAMSGPEYAAALSVPAFSPARGHAAQHVFYIAPDHLDVVHDCLQGGIETVGQWTRIAGTSLAERLGSAALPAREIGFRADLLEVFCALWKQGRGRSVDRGALAGSGALSERFLDDVVEIARELDGDAARLVAALGAGGDPRLRGFRRATLERVDQHLREHGYIDEKPVLSEGDLRLAALMSPAANALLGDARRCIDRWWAWAARKGEEFTGPQSRDGEIG